MPTLGVRVLQLLSKMIRTLTTGESLARVLSASELGRSVTATDMTVTSIFPLENRKTSLPAVSTPERQ